VDLSGLGNGVLIDTTVQGQVSFSWAAANVKDGSKANFAVVLFADGHMRFDYGAGNANLAPTIGISSGDGVHMSVLPYSGQSNLANANSVELRLTPGGSIADMGAYEFRGSSLDASAPTVTGTDPAQIQSGGSCGGAVDKIDVFFSEPLNPIDANALANYELRDSGPNNIFGDSDDEVYALRPDYAPGSTKVTLWIQGAELNSGSYRLTMYGDRSLHDLSGNQVDGDANGASGGDYVRVFSVDATVPDVLESQVNDGASQRSRLANIAVQFNTNVASSLTIDDVSLRNTSTNAFVGKQFVRIAYDTATNTARFTVQGIALAPGDYEFILAGTGILNNKNAPMQTDYILQFHLLPGDADGNRVVNDRDLYSEWQTLLQPVAARNIAASDLDGDGKVDMNDVAVVKANYLKDLRSSTAGVLSAVAASHADASLAPNSFEKPSVIAGFGLVLPFSKADAPPRVEPVCNALLYSSRATTQAIRSDYLGPDVLICFLPENHVLTSWEGRVVL
jgi:hypothetical protein